MSRFLILIFLLAGCKGLLSDRFTTQRNAAVENDVSTIKELVEKGTTYNVTFVVNKPSDYSEFLESTRTIVYRCLTTEEIAQYAKLLNAVGVGAREVKKTPSTEGCAK